MLKGRQRNKRHQFSMWCIYHQLPETIKDLKNKRWVSNQGLGCFAGNGVASQGRDSLKVRLRQRKEIFFVSHCQDPIHSLSTLIQFFLHFTTMLGTGRSFFPLLCIFNIKPLLPFSPLQVPDSHIYHTPLPTCQEQKQRYRLHAYCIVHYSVLLNVCGNYLTLLRGDNHHEIIKLQLSYQI